MTKRPARDRRGRYTRSNPSPWVLDMLVKPGLAAMVGHVGGRAAKAVTDRVVRASKRAKRRTK